ncbi:MAG: inosine-5-monophosphate dehydrogenase [Nitrosopumilales archaeon CG_4_10_14_0_8_um_filter_34_8]|nr:MAG: inosine-5-monophosphate dehydrogenase [Nitrosopumilales archaeon CG_4_10_14_0_8_um_filter_34_8]PJB96714.1 MAG: inosine-5-monophosphate dehydrogenase [Nitrosopumilales archaeon CG_4_9_14_0_8_um_filter_34_10]
MKHKRQPKILRDIPIELKSITKTPITIPPNTNILDARDILLRYRIGRLIVKLGKKAIGIITEKDIARSVSVFSGKPIEKILAKDIMSKDLISIPPTSSIYDCAKQMKIHDIRSIIIQDKRENLVGVITKTDLVSTFLAQSTASLNISKIMTKKVITVSPEDSVFEVQSVLFNSKISRVVVTKNKKPVGIITYRDFIPIKTFEPHKEFTNPAERDEASSIPQLNEFNVNQMSYLLTFSAKDIMTKDLVVTHPDNDVYTAAILMIRHGISGIPVIRNQKLMGIITKSDIVNVLASKGKLN